MKRVGLPAAVLALSTLAALWFAGQFHALLYTVLYVVAVLPGVPLGIALFGRRHPAAWIGGALLGYGLTQLTIWLVIESQLASSGMFVLAWLILLGTALLVRRAAGSEPAIRMPEWTAPDSAALLLVLVLVPVLMGPPVRQPGPRGRRRQSLLSRLLHRRFPVAQRARVRGRQVLAPAA